jgi:GTP-binding protein EngB required for normal cell division
MKKQLINFAQTAVTLLWLPVILLMTNCHGPMGVTAQELPSNNGKQEVVNTSSPSEIIVFCGNPGVGKSSLCNSIFQEKAFESGISDNGSGMTREKQEHIYENRKYIDTPGLSDVNLRKQAAEEIEKALKENNNYKIIFVATLEAGRIRPDDLVTMNTVCEAIKVPFEYGIIFNKVTEKVIKKNITAQGLESYLSDLHKKPSSTLIITKDENMEDEDNEYLPASSENRAKLINFISSLQANMILAKQVQAIDIRDYEKKVEEIETKLAEALKKAEEEREKHKKEIADLAEKTKRQELILQNQAVQINTIGSQLQAVITKAEEERVAHQKLIEQQRIETEALAARQSESLKKLQEEKLAQEISYKKLQEESKGKVAKQEEKLAQETKQISEVIPKLASNQEKLDEAIKIAPHGKAIVKALLSNSTSFTSNGNKEFEFTETDMAVLVNHPGFRKLTEFNLNNQELSAEILKILAPNLKGLTNLQNLYLNTNQIGDAGMQALAPNLEGLANLRSIWLNTNQIGDAGMQALAPTLKGLTNLRSLGLSNNQIGDAGMQALAPTLKGLTNLQALYLDRNQIEIGAVGMQALAPTLKGLWHLGSLSLSNNQISDAVAMVLGQHLQEVKGKTIYLCRNNISWGTQAWLRKQCPGIKWDFSS